MSQGQHTKLEGEWVTFVQLHGFRANAYDLAAVIGRTPEEVLQVKRTGTCSRLAQNKTFGELYALWHGRPPQDSDWPPPRRRDNGTYVWQTPELVLLSSLVGQMGAEEIAHALTARLRALTGDVNAFRTKNAVMNKTAEVGLQMGDVVGGITAQDAGREINSYAIVLNAIDTGELKANRVRHRIVIPYDAWEAWKAKRVTAPEGYVQLSTLKDALGIKSDKLSEYARMGYVPTAKLVVPYGASVATGSRGSWYVTAEQAEALLVARREGHQMPWHGKPMLDNLKKTYQLWQSRQHPINCEKCAQTWGEAGAPTTFDDYLLRYPPLSHGAKRHLTMIWTSGISVREVATQAGCSISHVHRAIESGMLAANQEKDKYHISQTDCTRWVARKCPTGDSPRSWIAIETAVKIYGFSPEQLQAFIAQGQLKLAPAGQGDLPAEPRVSRHQCGQLRERIGFTELEAASRLGVSLERLRELLEGVERRGAAGIPLSAIQTMSDRLKSAFGYTFEEAAQKLGVDVQWIEERRADGTFKVNRTKWNSSRLYVSEPMMRRLEKAKLAPGDHGKLSEDWLLLSDAALEAGVSTATVQNWANAGVIDRRLWRNIWRYHRDVIRGHAREYWKTVTRTRAMPPSWLAAEKLSAGGTIS